MGRSGLLLLSLLLLAIPVQSQTRESSFFKGLRYRLVGPARGGRVTTVTGVTSQPKTFYMGVASGGLFRTTDSGANWIPLTDGKIPLGSTGSVAVADSDPNIIYLGTGSDSVRSNVSTGRGVYKSIDGGETWKFIGLYDAGQIGAVRIHPTNPDVVWVAVGGDVFKSNDERGVFKTTDGGKTWRRVLFISDAVGAMDVELQPGNPNVVYAWMSRLERKPWTIVSGSREGGFYKSSDGGEHFSKISNGLPTELIGKANLAVTNANPNRIYALVEAKPGGGFYRSEDAGQTWALTNSQGSLIQRPFYYTTLGADPSNADVVYAGAEGFFKSTDAGKTFTPFRTPHGDNHDIWINPKDSQIMIQANDGGANVSTDGGRTWSSQMNQPTAEIYGVWVDDQFPYKLYSAQQDNTTLIISSQAEPFSTTDWRTGPGCETGPIMPHPQNPDIVYGSCKGQYGVMNLKTGQEKSYWIGGQSLYGNPARDLIYRMQRVSPMATSPHDPDVLYYGSQYVHRTRDKGVTWERISPDLTAHPDCCQGASGEPITRDVTGEEFVLKIANALESSAFLEAQNSVLKHLEHHVSFCQKLLPPTSGEEIATVKAANGATHFVRMVHYLPGVPLAELKPHSKVLVRDLGRKLGQLARALADFDHQAVHRDFHWDLANGNRVVNEFAGLVDNASLSDLVLQCRFEPQTSLRRSVIHGDPNDYNLLVNPHSATISGLIDFGDMVYSYTVGDLAIAIAYVILDKTDPHATATEIVNGYESEFALLDDEREALWPLVRLRLAMSVCLAAHQLKQQPENEYLQISQRAIEENLPRILRG